MHLPVEVGAEWAMRSFFGRVNLDWQQKYLPGKSTLRADQSFPLPQTKVPDTPFLHLLHGV